VGIIATAPSPSTLLPRGLQVLLTGLVLLLATTAVGVVALLNVVWFDLVNGIVESRDTIVRGLLFSSWLIVIGAPIDEFTEEGLPAYLEANGYPPGFTR
jgi:hypothetical protein